MGSIGASIAKGQALQGCKRKQWHWKQVAIKSTCDLWHMISISQHVPWKYRIWSEYLEGIAVSWTGVEQAIVNGSSGTFCSPVTGIVHVVGPRRSLLEHRSMWQHWMYKLVHGASMTPRDFWNVFFFNCFSVSCRVLTCFYKPKRSEKCFFSHSFALLSMFCCLSGDWNLQVPRRWQQWPLALGCATPWHTLWDHARWVRVVMPSHLNIVILMLYLDLFKVILLKVP